MDAPYAMNQGYWKEQVLIELQGMVAEWMDRSTCNVEITGSSLHSGGHCASTSRTIAQGYLYSVKYAQVGQYQTQLYCIVRRQ